MQFLLRFHRFCRLLNSATAALSSRIDAHTLAGPQRVSAFPQDVVSPASKASPDMSDYLVDEFVSRDGDVPCSWMYSVVETAHNDRVAYNLFFVLFMWFILSRRISIRVVVHKKTKL